MRRRRGAGIPVGLLAVVASVGCGKSQGSEGPGPAADVEEALTRLGVDISSTPRLDADGNPVPEDYAPLGATEQVQRLDELLLVGMTIEDPESPDSYLPGQLAWLDTDEGVPAVLHAPEEPDWVRDPAEPDSFAQTRRTFLAGDIDGDGFDETLAAYLQDDAGGNVELLLTVFQDSEGSTPFESESDTLFTTSDIQDVRGTTVDFDGDGDDDVVLALSDGLAFTFLFVRNDEGTFGVDEEATRVVEPLNPQATHLSTAVTRAGLDDDAGEEIVATLIEYQLDEMSGAEAGTTRYLILDDANKDFETLALDYVTAFVGGALENAVAADVAAGDIDADGRDEIVFGGVPTYEPVCDNGEVYHDMYLALDDALHAFNRIGEGAQETSFSLCGLEGDDLQVRWSPTGVLDIDKDLVPEVRVGRWVFQDWTEAAPFTVLHEIPKSDWSDGIWVDRNNVAVAGADFTGDGYAEVATYFPKTEDIKLWGLEDGAFSQTLSHPVERFGLGGGEPFTNPVLLPVNPDHDSIRLSWEGDHELIFTEPIILAALAAPPCFDGIGQNTDACVTTYGRSESETIDKTLVLTATAKVFIGVEIMGGAASQSKFQLKATLFGSVSKSTGSSYTLTQAIAHTTGPLEDSVIFTTIPYDQYTYTVVTHPDPEMVGVKTKVAVPREKITLVADREFYNQSVTEDALRVEERVFQHQLGSPYSYPDRETRDALLDSHGGLSSQTATVGQGTGSTELLVEVGEAHSEGRSLEVGFEIEVEATGGTILGGFAIGASRESNLVYTSGEATTYTGSVGSIPAEQYGEDRIYDFGLFTYPYTDQRNGQEYEVVNYWVQ